MSDISHAVARGNVIDEPKSICPILFHTYGMFFKHRMEVRTFHKTWLCLTFETWEKLEGKMLEKIQASIQMYEPITSCRFLSMYSLRFHLYELFFSTLLSCNELCIYNCGNEKIRMLLRHFPAINVEQWVIGWFLASPMVSLLLLINGRFFMLFNSIQRSAKGNSQETLSYVFVSFVIVRGFGPICYKLC